MLQKRCLYKMKDDTIINNAAFLHKQEQNFTNESMETLEAHDLGQVLTLQEVMSSLEMNQEGSIYQLKLTTEHTKDQERVVRLRSSEVFFEGQVACSTDRVFKTLGCSKNECQNACSHISSVHTSCNCTVNA